MDIRLDTPDTLHGTTQSGNPGADVVVLPNGQLELDGGLRTAIHLSLFTDRLAAPESPSTQRASDEPMGDRRGYWADFLSPIPDDHWGSRLWQLRVAGAVLTDQTEGKVRDFCREALAWIEALGIGSVEISTERLEEPGNLRVHIDVIDDLTGDRRRYSFLWDAMVRDGV